MAKKTQNKNFTLSTQKTLGIYLLLIGISILLTVLFPNIKLFILLAFIIVISINLIILAVLKPSNRKLIIPGIILLLLSTFFIIYFLFLIKIVHLIKIWPALGFIPSISLIIYYSISKNKRIAIIIPGIFLGIMSLVLLLITIGFLKMGFKNFIISIIASMLIIAGLYIFFHAKINEFKKNNFN